MTVPTSPHGSVIRIVRFNVHCLLPREHPSPLALRSKLAAIAERQLPSVCAKLLSPLCPEDDPSVWLIRRLDVEVAIDAHGETDRLAHFWSQPLARELLGKVRNGDDGSDVLHFPSRAEYIAQFLCDLVDGVAWSKWYYGSLGGLRLLPIGTALREALCGEPTIGEAALLCLVDDGRSDKVLRAMNEADCAVVLVALCGNHQEPRKVTTAHLQAAWRAWQLAHYFADERASRHHIALQLYLTIRRGDAPPPPSPSLFGAIQAVVALVRWMASPNSDSLLAAFRRNDTAAAFNALREDDIESLNVLLRCEGSFVAEIAEQLRQPTSRSQAGRVTSGEPFFTPFGGIFYLLPHVDELGPDEFAPALPEFEGEAPTPLVRFLVLLKCLGAHRIHRAFFDPALREVAGMPTHFDADTVREWARSVSRQMVDDFQARWIASCQRRGAVKTLRRCIRSARRGRLLLLTDCERDIWLCSARFTKELVHFMGTGLQPTLRAPRSALHALEVLLCDPTLVSMLPASIAGVPVFAWNSSEGVEHATEKSALATWLALAHSPDEDLNYLSLIPLLRGTRHLDLALSLVARAVLRGFAWCLPGFAWNSASYLYENFIAVAATIRPQRDRWLVCLARAPLQVVLTMTGGLHSAYRVSWLDEQSVQLTVREP